MNTLTIDDLGSWCARQRARFLDLVELLAAWAQQAEPGAQQRRWLTASHRHAWHAELCRARAPTIPTIDIESATAMARGIDAPTEPDDTWYAEQLAVLRREVEALMKKVDSTVDPSTARLCQLLDADLD